MKYRAVLLLSLLTLASLTPGLAFADDLYQQEDILTITQQAGSDMDEFYRPKADILIDANTGNILYGDNIDVVRDSGSMAKLMTAYVLFRTIKEGKLNYDTVVTATENDQAISENPQLSNVPIYAGVDYKISDLIDMLFVPSSSAATIMIANAVSNNDPDAFMDLMNQYAQDIGMTKSKWYNPNGAPTSVLEGRYSPTRYDNYATNEITARDMAILGYHLVNDFPEALNYTKNSKVTVMKGTPYEATYDNYNASLEGGKHALAGADGLKTGSSPTADYNYSVTVKRGNQRFIEIIMGVGHYDVELAESYRHIIGNALAERMFEDYEYKEVLAAGQHQIDGKTYQLDQPFYATVKKGSQPKLTVQNNQLSVDNGLQSVSSKISHTASVTEQTGFFSSPNTAETVKFNPMWIFCLLPIGILRWIFKRKGIV